MLTLQVRADGPIGGITVTADSHGQCKRICGQSRCDAACQE